VFRPSQNTGTSAVSQCDIRAYRQSTDKSAATEQNKSAVTDHAITLNHIIDWDQAKVIDRESKKWTDGSKKQYTSEKNKTSL